MKETQTRTPLVLVALALSAGGGLFLSLALMIRVGEVQRPMAGEEDRPLFVLTGKVESIDAATRSLVLSAMSPFPPHEGTPVDGGEMLRYRVSVASPAFLVRTTFETRGGVIMRLSAQRNRTISRDLRELYPGMLVKVIGRRSAEGAESYLARFIAVNEFIEEN